MARFNKISLKPKSAVVLFMTVFIMTQTLGSVRKLSTEELTNKANSIVIGKVRCMKSNWEAVNEGKRIFTYVNIIIEKYIKGCGEKMIEIKVPGGMVGDITEWVSDMPQFTIEEEVIVFLKPKYFQVVGLNQGKFTVKNNIVLGLEIPINDFIDMIKRIDKESNFGSKLIKLAYTKMITQES